MIEQKTIVIDALVDFVLRTTRDYASTEEIEILPQISEILLNYFADMEFVMNA